jgi:hypothetical protein
LADIQKELGELETVIEGKTNKAIAAKKRVVLDKIGNLEQLMVQSFPYEYAHTIVSCRVVGHASSKYRSCMLFWMEAQSKSQPGVNDLQT